VAASATALALARRSAALASSLGVVAGLGELAGLEGLLGVEQVVLEQADVGLLASGLVVSEGLEDFLGTVGGGGGDVELGEEAPAGFVLGPQGLGAGEEGARLGVGPLLGQELPLVDEAVELRGVLPALGLTLLAELLEELRGVALGARGGRAQGEQAGREERENGKSGRRSHGSAGRGSGSGRAHAVPPYHCRDGPRPVLAEEGRQGAILANGVDAINPNPHMEHPRSPRGMHQMSSAAA